jgi:DNA-directed RNA polymerase subunit RPC12/RpoP
MPTGDQVNLNDDGNAEFDITDRATGDVVTVKQVEDELQWQGFEDDELNARYIFRCRKCGSENCAIDNGVRMGSSWTGMYGSADLACKDCGASRLLWDP